ncbi:MAG: TIGR04222 domain-containing membrane protein [Erythrobacter sp.]
MISGFSTYSGSEFLLFYGGLLATAFLAGASLPHFLRAEGQKYQVSDPLHLAYLAGGPGRLTDTVLARLMGVGALRPYGTRKLTVADLAAGRNAAEQALLRTGGEFGITAAHKIIKPYGDDIGSQLVDRGLLMDGGSRWMMRIVSTLPYLVVLAIGWYRREAGQALGEPVGFLTALMVLTALMALIRFAKLDPKTQAGQDAVDEARQSQARLKSAPTDAELGLGVALFGTAILAGTPYSELHAMRQAATNGADGGYSSDGGDSGGGDGGCGGGCGGCGG